jgi:endopeptidase Clp ATP-binding regulatory subunit ClpX
MTNNEDKKTDGEDISRQIHDMFRQAKIHFAQFPGAQESAPDQGPAEKEENPNEEALEKIRSFQLKPREVRDYLDRFVIRQNEAKKVLSVAICDHYNHIRRCLEDSHAAQDEYTKQNVILLGPTGVGKTYLMRCIAKLIGVPFVKADATKFSETGYVGYDVDDIVRDLVRNANNDPELAQYGIVYIDEIDKIASKSSQGGRDVSGRGVQTNLLKLMEETDVNLQSQTDLVGQMQAVMDMQRGGRARKRTVNTRHILFIVSGAFDGIGEVIRKRVATGSIGFGTEQKHTMNDDHLLKQVATPDFITYGFEPEFIGRLPVRVICENLNADDLEKILLQSEGSILRQYVHDFRGYGIEMKIDPAALRRIAERAALEKTGARGLMTVLETILRDFKFELPSTTIKELTIDGEAMDNPHIVMENLFKANESAQRQNLRQEVTRYAERFHADTGLTIEFTDDATNVLVEKSLQTNKTVRAICEELFRDYEFGLKLINKNTGQQKFVISSETAENSIDVISRWVRDSYAAAGQS